jgi:NSS family neurotransmitter:Na+ symporter
MAEQHSRENWGSRFGAIMSMAGMGIGLGSVWRFPFLVGEYGGGVFVLAYFFVILAIVAPLAIVETGIGKGIGKGVIDTYIKIFQNQTIGTMLGGASVLLYLSLNFFFLAILGICTYFLYVCAFSLWDTIPPDQIYDHIMGEKWTMLMLFTIICIFTSYVIWRGIGEGIEKVSKVMVPGIFVCFGITIIYTAVQVPNISEGFDFYLNPDFSKLGSLKMWVSAIGQALFAVGVGPGCVLVYGSHLGKKSDVSLNAVNLCMLVLCAGLIAGMAIIPPCIAFGLDPASGSKLIFVVLPTLLSKIPFGNFLGIFLFAAIFFAAITTAFAQLEVPVTTFMDRFNLSRGMVTLVMTILTLACSIPAIFDEQVRIFWENLGGNYGFTVTAGIGAVCFCWFYGVRRIREEFVNPTSDFQLGTKFDFWTRYVATPIMVFILVNALFGLL